LTNDSFTNKIRAVFLTIVFLFRAYQYVHTILPNAFRMLFASKEFQIGELILNEIPLLHVQKVSNKNYVKVCSHCMCFLGPLDYLLWTQLQLINEESESSFLLPFASECCPVVPRYQKCSKCSEIFCSKECLEISTASYHSILCNNPLVLTFQEHIQQHFEEHTETFLLVLKLYATLTSQLRLVNCLESAWKPYKDFCATSWLNLNFGQTSKDSVAILQQSLQIMKDLLWNEHTIQTIFDLKFYDFALGMIQQNATKTKIHSPLNQYFYNLELFAEKEEEDDDSFKRKKISQVFSVAQRIQEVHDTFIYACGVGIFPTHHFLNHSCDPCAVNGALDWKTAPTDARATLYAAKDISLGEELCIPYLPVMDLTLEKRKKILKEVFSFDCNCIKCQKENEKLTS